MPDSKPRSRRPMRTLLTGMLAALPLLGTLWLLMLVIDFILALVGPESRTGRVLGMVGIEGYEWSGYLIGLALAVAILFGLGLLIERGFSTWMVWLVDTVVGRIPVVRTIYETIEKFVQIFAKREKSELHSMRPVWCRFGGDGVAVLALLSSPQAIMVNGRACYVVIVPTAPVPIGGGLLFVPVEWISSAEVGMEAVTSIYVSMGVTAPQFLPNQPQAPDPQRMP